MTLNLGSGFFQNADLSHIAENASPYAVEASLENLALVNAGVMAEVDEIRSALAGGQKTFTVPEWNILPRVPPKVGNDSASQIDSTKPGTKAQNGIKHLWTERFAWSFDVVASAKSDPEGWFGDATADLMRWWTNRGAFQLLRGLELSEVGGEAGTDNPGTQPLVYTIGDSDNSAVPADETQELNEQSLPIIASQVMGEQMDGFSVLVTHPDIRGRLSALAGTSFQRQDEQGTIIKQFGDYAVMADENCPKVNLDVGGTNKLMYTSYLLRPNAFGYNQAEWLAGSLALEVDQGAGDGAGAVVGTIRQFGAMHLMGMDWTGANDAYVGQAEMAVAGNWRRVWENRRMGVIAIRHAQ